MVESTTNNTNNTNKKPNFFSSHILAITLGVLIVIIAGLAVGVVLANQSQNEGPDLTLKSDYPTEPADLASDILNRYEEDVNYTKQDALDDFASTLNSLEGNDKVEFAIEYARFCYENDGNPRAALDVLDSVRDIVSEDTEISYYFAYVDIYEYLGDFTTAAKYYNILAEKYPNMIEPYDIAKQKELEYENPTE